jgi:hypothetical protein
MMPIVAICVYCSHKIEEKEKSVNAPGGVAHLACAQKVAIRTAPRPDSWERRPSALPGAAPALNRKPCEGKGHDAAADDDRRRDGQPEDPALHGTAEQRPRGSGGRVAITIARADLASVGLAAAMGGATAWLADGAARRVLLQFRSRGRR